MSTIVNNPTDPVPSDPNVDPTATPTPAQLASLPILDTLTAAGALVSVDLFNQIATILNYMADGMPVGTIVFMFDGFIYTDQHGNPQTLPAPDLNVWQICDGSTVSNPNSTMFGQSVPSLAGPSPVKLGGVDGATSLYYINEPANVGFGGNEGPIMKCVAIGESSVYGAGVSQDMINSFSGAYYLQLSHDHGGVTGITNPGDGGIANGHTFVQGHQDHTHTISADLGVVSLAPPMITGHFYVKVL